MLKRLIAVLFLLTALPALAGPTGGPAQFPPQQPYTPPTTAQTVAALQIPAPYLGNVATRTAAPQYYGALAINTGIQFICRGSNTTWYRVL